MAAGVAQREMPRESRASLSFNYVRFREFRVLGFRVFGVSGFRA